MTRSICLLVLLISFSGCVFGQNQLVLLKHETVAIRFIEGDDFEYKRKSMNHYEKGYILSIGDFAVITNRDTIEYASLERIRFPDGNKKHIVTKLGKLLVIAGVGYLVVDLLNAYVFDVHSGVDEDVVKASAIMAGTGAVLWLIPKNSVRLKTPYRLLKANPQSPFYR
ncbi:MAG: hypothetical protein HC811_06905 [Flammeovirgaceae bacterium]|nr:hypothetical protein [Flammeovirgaceae bacterium]